MFSRAFTHRFIGVILLVIPLTILLTILFDKFIASLVSRISMGRFFLCKPLRFFGLHRLKYLKNKKIDKKFLLTAFYSSLLGGITHPLLDLPTHPNVVLFYPWIIYAPALIENVIINIGTLTILKFQIPIQFSLTRRLWDLFLIPITLYMLRYITKNNLVNKKNSTAL